MLKEPGTGGKVRKHPGLVASRALPSEMAKKYSVSGVNPLSSKRTIRLLAALAVWLSENCAPAKFWSRLRASCTVASWSS